MEQKTIFITGASRGIGKSIALLFASRGYHTFLNCSSSVDELKKLRAYITEKYHTPCTLVPGNVGNPDHVRAIKFIRNVHILMYSSTMQVFPILIF